MTTYPLGPEVFAGASPGESWTPAPNRPDDGYVSPDSRDEETTLDESWQPIDLGPAWRGEKTRPEAIVFRRDDGVALMPAGINYIHGDSGDGKSMVAIVAALGELQADRAVIWVTYEDANEDVVIDRLRLLGATDADVDRLTFITPQEGLTHGAQHLAELAITGGARLFVLDSVGEAMGAGGINEDKDNEVGPWFRQTLRAISDQAPELAILPIDHSTKSKDNPLFPSGSKRKRAAPTGRAYLLNVRSPFAIGQVGYVQLVVAKDRGGTFKRGVVAAEIMLDATVVPYRVTVKAPKDGDTPVSTGRRKAEERVREVLGEAAVAVTAEEITRIANGPDRRRQGEADLSIKTVKNTLTALAKSPEVTQIVRPEKSGRGVPATWALSSHERPEGGET